MEVMDYSLGQPVLKSKANVSYDCKIVPCQTWPMAKDTANSEYEAAFMRRTREARLARGYTQAKIAKLLDITQDHYKHFEKRSLLPHYLVEKFCLACGIEVTWLLTGEGRGPAKAAEPGKQTRRPKTRARPAAA